MILQELRNLPAFITLIYPELDPEILKKFPHLTKFVKDIEDIDTVSKYLKNRPELVGVGTEPKLVINGTEHPTGVNKT